MQGGPLTGGPPLAGLPQLQQLLVPKIAKVCERIDVEKAISNVTFSCPQHSRGGLRVIRWWHPVIDQRGLLRAINSSEQHAACGTLEECGEGQCFH